MKKGRIILGIIFLFIILVNTNKVLANEISGNDASNILIKFAQEQGFNSELVNYSDLGSLYSITLKTTDTNQLLVGDITKDGKYLFNEPQKINNESVNITEKDFKRQFSYMIARSSLGNMIYIKHKDLGYFYNVTVRYQGRNINLYITKDLMYLTYNVLQISDSDNNIIPKKSKPKVELFVLTYCPYGSQMEKAILPVVFTLDKKIDFKIYYDPFFMHGDIEENETYRQICIKRQQKENFLDYIDCFSRSGDAQKCINYSEVNVRRLNLCTKNSAKNYYKSESKVAEKYGVQSCPELFINGVLVNVDRNPQAIVNAICSGFNKEPEECSYKFSTTSPSPGFSEVPEDYLNQGVE